jgi:hypothetical protein
MSLEAHRDADEVLARTERKLRYPHFGHVLYLDVGEQVRTPASARHERARRTHARASTHTNTHTHEHTHEHTQQVRGPTLVFDDGGESVKKMESLYVVPAQTGVANVLLIIDCLMMEASL